MTQAFSPCDTCKDKAPLSKPGYYYVDIPHGKEGKTIQTLVECDCHKSWVNLNQLLIKLKNARISTLDINYDLNQHYIGNKSRNVLPVLAEYLLNYESKNYRKSLFLYGVNNAQKTTTAKWLGRELIKQGFSVYYILMQELIQLLSSFYKEDSREVARQGEISKLLNIDFLIIDESFNKDKVAIAASEYQLPYLDQFIRERLEIQGKSTCFISNASPAELLETKMSTSLRYLILRNTEPHGYVLGFFDDISIAKSSMVDVEGVFV
jgi:DNA replication protein DnaC